MFLQWRLCFHLLLKERQLSCPLSTVYTTLHICTMFKRSFVKPDIFCPYQRFPQYPARLPHSGFMFFHLFVCFCINLFRHYTSLRCQNISIEREAEFYHFISFNKLRNDRCGPPVLVWVCVCGLPGQWGQRLHVSCNRKYSEWVVSTHTLNGVWMCVCRQDICTQHMLSLSCSPVYLLFQPFSTILVFVPDKKRPHSKDPYLSTASLQILFKASPPTHTLPPLSHLKPCLSSPHPLFRISFIGMSI